MDTGFALLVSPQRLRHLTGLDLDPEHARELLAQASGLVRTWCGWHIAPRITEHVTADGPGSAVLGLPTLRLVDLYAVTENNQPVDLAEVEWSAAGFVIRRHCRWTRALRGVQAEILHGHTQTPAEVRAVVAAIVARAVAHPPAQAGVASQRTGPFQVTYTQSARDGGMALLPFEERVLDRYTLPARA